MPYINIIIIKIIFIIDKEWEVLSLFIAYAHKTIWNNNDKNIDMWIKKGITLFLIKL